MLGGWYGLGAGLLTSCLGLEGALAGREALLAGLAGALAGREALLAGLAALLVGLAALCAGLLTGARAFAGFLADLLLFTFGFCLLEDLFALGLLLSESCPEISCSSAEADILFPEPDFFAAM
jgi:hypothetical protein